MDLHFDDTFLADFVPSDLDDLLETSLFNDEPEDSYSWLNDRSTDTGTVTSTTFAQNSSSDLSITSEIRDYASSAAEQQAKSLRKKPTLLRTPRRDIRKDYFTMFTNVLNSADESCIGRFLNATLVPSAVYEYSCPNGDRRHFGTKFLLEGPNMIYRFFSGRSLMYPDSCIVLKDVKVKASPNSTTSKVIAGITCLGTKIFQLSLAEWIPGLKVLSRELPNNSIDYKGTTSRSSTSTSCSSSSSSSHRSSNNSNGTAPGRKRRRRLLSIDDITSTDQAGHKSNDSRSVQQVPAGDMCSKDNNQFLKAPIHNFAAESKKQLLDLHQRLAHTTVFPQAYGSTYAVGSTTAKAMAQTSHPSGLQQQQQQQQQEQQQEQQFRPLASSVSLTALPEPIYQEIMTTLTLTLNEQNQITRIDGRSFVAKQIGSYPYSSC